MINPIFLTLAITAAYSRPYLFQHFPEDLLGGSMVGIISAILAIKENKKYLSQDLKQASKENNTHEFSEYDITVITLLAKGALQKDIPTYLEQLDIKPAGLSSVEKRLNLIRETLGFTKNEQLIAFCKDMGVI